MKIKNLVIIVLTLSLILSILLIIDTFGLVASGVTEVTCSRENGGSATIRLSNLNNRTVTINNEGMFASNHDYTNAPWRNDSVCVIRSYFKGKGSENGI